MSLINCRGQLLSLETPVVMGILNVTPDSFYDGGRLNSAQALVDAAGKHISEGAAILDLGAVSTRPGATEISENEELDRLLPALEGLRKAFPGVIISADTSSAAVALRAADAGASMINDISGLSDADMPGVLASKGLPYVLMHIQGTPATMQKDPVYRHLIAEVTDFFCEKISTLKAAGVHDILLDPGFGFGKTTEHNYRLLKHLRVFRELGYPVLAGVSRKSMINKVLGTSPALALNGTTAVNTIALLNGAKILRVHDVKEAAEAIKIAEFYLHVD